MMLRLSLLLAVLAAPAFASGCPSPKEDPELCAAALALASNAMKGPRSETAAPEPLKGNLRPKWVVADGERVITVLALSQKQKALLAALSEAGLTSQDYQTVLKEGMRMELCGTDAFAGFIAAGGRVTTIFESADGAVFAAVATTQCTPEE